MKSFFAVLLLSFAARHEAFETPIIAPVIDMLSKMLNDSRTDEAEDDKMFASFRDHCVSTTAEAEKQIAGLTETDEILDAELDKLSAEKDKVEEEIEDLEHLLARNNESQAKSNSTREKENDEYNQKLAHDEKLVDGLETAQGQLGAVDVSLLAVSGSATLGLEGKASAAWEGMRQIQKSRGAAKSFLQVRGFDDVQGIIKNSIRQATSDVKDLKTDENASLASYDKLMGDLKKAESALTEDIDSKSSLKGNLASDIATKDGQQKTTRETLKDDRAYLADLTQSCQKKTSIYKQRSALRKQEDAAISMALAVLNSDRSDRVFKKMSADSADSFMQMDAVQSSQHTDAEVSREVHGSSFSALVAMLQDEATKSGSTRLSRIAALARLESRIDGNPFAIVLIEIDKMKASISKESGLDKKQLSWCQNERATSNSATDMKDEELTSLDDAITKLNISIEGPTNGLLATIAEEEKQLADNVIEQKDTTKERKDDNRKYVKEIQNNMLAQGMLEKALSTLQDYYEKVKAHELNSLVQTEKPAAWNSTSMSDKASASDPNYTASAYDGQSQSGNAVITKISEILADAQEEEAEAHQGEATAQDTFEGTMALLGTQQTNLFGSLAENKKDLASAMLNLKNRRSEEAAAQKQKATIEEYLRQIKPACDFITTSFDTREASRGLEEKSLTKAQSLITNSPAYQKLSDEAKRKRY